MDVIKARAQIVWMIYLMTDQIGLSVKDQLNDLNLRQLLQKLIHKVLFQIRMALKSTLGLPLKLTVLQ